MVLKQNSTVISITALNVPANIVYLFIQQNDLVNELALFQYYGFTYIITNALSGQFYGHAKERKENLPIERHLRHTILRHNYVGYLLIKSIILDGTIGFTNFYT